MRTLFCNYEYPPLGDGGVLSAYLAEELLQRYDVTISKSRALGMPDMENMAGVEVISVPVLIRRSRLRNGDQVSPYYSIC